MIELLDWAGWLATAGPVSPQTFIAVFLNPNPLSSDQKRQRLAATTGVLHAS